MSKETYYGVKRDLLHCQKREREISMSGAFQKNEIGWMQERERGRETEGERQRERAGAAHCGRQCGKTKARRNLNKKSKIDSERAYTQVRQQKSVHASERVNKKPCVQVIK